MPIGYHQDGHSDSVFCLTAALPEDLVLVELTFVSWVSIPIRLHATLLAKKEEQQMLGQFGTQYALYQQQVPMFFPKREDWKPFLTPGGFREEESEP